MLGGRYRVLDRIGVGGMAEVFRACDELLARDVAVKVFRALPAAPDTASGVGRQEIELRALARLNHPNLITLFDGSIGESDARAYLVMELITGPTLAARIADGPLAEPQAREVGIQIADALAYVHGLGMVHRDVKPANILLGTDTTHGDMTVRARLSDFGIVRLLGSERMTSVEFTLGTASYLAPEQARGSDVGPAADVYSLGLVLIEALTGVRSYDGPPLEAVLARLKHGPDVPDDLPPPWPTLLAAMTATDPAARPTATQVADALRGTGARLVPSLLPATAVGGGEAATVGFASVTAASEATAAAASPTATRPVHPQAARRRRGGGLILAAVVFVAIVIVGAFLLLRPGSSPKSPTDPLSGTPSNIASKSSSGAHSNPAVPVNDSRSPTSSATSTHSSTSSGPPTGSTTSSTGAPTTPTTSAPPPNNTTPATTAATTASSNPAANSGTASTSPAPSAAAAAAGSQVSGVLHG
jgi:eukaryotic-like serine/threonine-protein kinase